MAVSSGPDDGLETMEERSDPGDEGYIGTPRPPPLPRGGDAWPGMYI